MYGEKKINWKKKQLANSINGFLYLSEEDQRGLIVSRASKSFFSDALALIATANATISGFSLIPACVVWMGSDRVTLRVDRRLIKAPNRCMIYSYSFSPGQTTVILDPTTSGYDSGSAGIFWNTLIKNISQEHPSDTSMNGLVAQCAHHAQCV